jgi:cell division protein FtsB
LIRGFVPLSTRIHRIKRGPLGIPYRVYYWFNVGLFVFLGYLVFQFGYSFYEQSRLLELEQAELERVERHIRQQAEVIERLKTDPEARREVAEAELWMVAPNEIVLQFDEENERIVRIHMGSSDPDADGTNPGSG